MDGIADNGDSSRLKTEIQRYLVETGSYQTISNQLTERLLQDGWIDAVRGLIASEMRSSNSSNYSEILAKVEPKALEMVSQPIKEQVLSQIETFLDEIVDKR
ncbi:hypothetical protein HG536_0B02120 [Torulaspora globosa]|uniref:Transcription and mRNA export factor SUS1 n=1 Tax=Torulaspora globosa TaxID=48254 RepID=A0A7G3ZCW3_9SACH|nr:uncharacterized protein HG536_0B02120 [Torulaspora globosa]QLL31349.1 hypothetical protein HG536_0B02120 [Torulaspora globosa]